MPGVSCENGHDFFLPSDGQPQGTIRDMIERPPTDPRKARPKLTWRRCLRKYIVGERAET